MNVFMCIIIYLLLMYAGYLKFQHSLQMLQQSSYYFGRYGKWIGGHPLTVLQPVELITLLGASVAFLTPKLATGLMIIGVLLTIYSYTYRLKLQNKKPLVWTWRVKRLTVTCLVMMGLEFSIGFFVIQSLGVESNFVTIALIMTCLVALVYIQVLLANIVNQPVEKYVRNTFINDAKQIVNNHKNLNVIGITGSYGKTTTKHVVSTIMSEAFHTVMTPESYNTPMGITITIRKFLKPIHQVFVCEMGAYKKGEIQELVDIATPHIGILTSIGPQHLETFGTLDNVQRTKFELIEGLPKSGIGILNKDEPLIAAYEVKNNCKIVYYGIDRKDVEYGVKNIEYYEKGMNFTAIIEGEEYSMQTQLLGHHNLQNILAGIATAHQSGESIDAIIKGVSKLKAPPHRLEMKKQGLYTLIDDAFNANPVGSKMALNVLGQMPGKKIVITPGMIDLGKEQIRLNVEYAEAMSEVADYVILVGKKQAEVLEQGLIKHGFPKEQYYIASDIHDALKKMNTVVEEGAFVLLANDLPDLYL
ncbi:MAG: Mur ligase family protein [Culicoidibacterales bacterium]